MSRLSVAILKLSTGVATESDTSHDLDPENWIAPETLDEVPLFADPGADEAEEPLPEGAERPLGEDELEVVIGAAREAAEQSDISFTAVTGTFDELLKAAEEWTILPEILMIEVPKGADPATVLGEFGQRLPEGEAEMILYNIPNDIRVYRELKAAGVREVFPGYASTEELAEVFEEIRRTALRRSGIDPRKAVYVFSACGGAGGTSLATTMARKFAREGMRTLYIDLDLATGPGSFMFNAERGARETMALMEALANPSRIDALFLERAIDTATYNLFYLSARRRSSDPDPVPESIPVLIARAQQNFDMVVIDIPWRPNPEPDMLAVQGHCYVVAPPSPAGLLGFSILCKEISSAPARNPVFGVINRSGEFKSNDIEKGSFKEAGDIEIHAIPYDAASAGRMFFEQKTYIDMGGRIRSAVERVLKTLPGEAGAEGGGRKSRRAAKGAERSAGRDTGAQAGRGRRSRRRK